MLINLVLYKQPCMTLIFGRLTCKIIKQDQQKQTSVIIREPITKSCLFPMVSDREWCWFPGLAQGRFSAGPLVSDINMAPPTVTTVPSILAWQFIFLISTFSSLNKHTQNYFNFHIKLHFCGNVYEQGLTWKSRPLERQKQESYCTWQMWMSLWYISFPCSTGSGQAQG